MDGFLAPTAARTPPRPLPGASFGDVPLTARLLDAGMGLAVARRTVFRAEDDEDFGRVADRVAQCDCDRGVDYVGAAFAAWRFRAADAEHGGVYELRHGDCFVCEVLFVVEWVGRGAGL